MGKINLLIKALWACVIVAAIAFAITDFDRFLEHANTFVIGMIVGVYFARWINEEVKKEADNGA